MEVHPLSSLSSGRVFLGERPDVLGLGAVSTRTGGLSVPTQGYSAFSKLGGAYTGYCEYSPIGCMGSRFCGTGSTHTVPFVVIAGARIGRLFSACEFACLCDSLLLCWFVWLFVCFMSRLGSALARLNRRRLLVCEFVCVGLVLGSGLGLFVCLFVCTPASSVPSRPPRAPRPKSTSHRYTYRSSKARAAPPLCD